MKKLVLLPLMAVLLASCGVKKAEPVSTIPAVQSGSRDLPEKVRYTSNKLFLVKPSVDQIQVGDEKEEYRFRIDYFITTNELAPLSDAYSIEVKYGMPSMPLMKIKPAVITYPESGKVSVLYSIDMAQDWRMEIKILKKDGTLSDTINYDYYIPE